MLSTMLMFRSLRFMPRFTSREKTTVSTAESTKLRGLMSRPNMTISTSTVRMMNMCSKIPPTRPSSMPITVRTLDSR